MLYFDPDVFWSGDLNYRCVQGGSKGERDKGIVAEVSLTFLEKGESRQMFEQYDQVSVTPSTQITQMSCRIGNALRRSLGMKVCPHLPFPDLCATTTSQLSIEMGRREVFFDFAEPTMVDDFYPTYVWICSFV